MTQARVLLSEFVCEYYALFCLSARPTHKVYILSTLLWLDFMLGTYTIFLPTQGNEHRLRALGEAGLILLGQNYRYAFSIPFYLFRFGSVLINLHWIVLDNFEASGLVIDREMQAIGSYLEPGKSVVYRIRHRIQVFIIINMIYTFATLTMAFFTSRTFHLNSSPLIVMNYLAFATIYTLHTFQLFLRLLHSYLVHRVLIHLCHSHLWQAPRFHRALDQSHRLEALVDRAERVYFMLHKLLAESISYNVVVAMMIYFVMIAYMHYLLNYATFPDRLWRLLLNRYITYNILLLYIPVVANRLPVALNRFNQRLYGYVLYRSILAHPCNRCCARVVQYFTCYANIYPGLTIFETQINLANVFKIMTYFYTLVDFIRYQF